MRATTNSIIAASLFIRNPKFILNFPVLNQRTDVSNIGSPLFMNMFANKLRAVHNMIPIKGKANQCAELLIFFPNNMRIKKDARGKNKLSKARVVE